MSSEIKGGTCWHCGDVLSELDYGRGDTCPKCGWDTRTCKNCFFYDPSCNNECREPQADRVVEKERSNFCDYFRPRADAERNPNASKDALKSAAEALFKKK
jgi:hypothetical protein